MSDVRLGFVTGRPMCSTADGALVDVGVSRLLALLAPSVASLVVAGSDAPPSPGWLDHPVPVDRSDIVVLPPMRSTLRGTRHTLEVRRRLQEVERRADVVVVQLPFPAPAALLGARTPRLYHLCGDPGAMGRTAAHYAGWRRAFGLPAGIAVEQLYHRLIGRPRTRVIANGDDLARKYGGERCRTIVSATLTEAEIGSVARARGDATPRLLFVGRLGAEKGIDVLLHALPRIRRAVPGTQVVLVGPSQVHDRGVEELLASTEADPQLAGAIVRRGPVRWGPDLFQELADADVLVLPSRSEGTPRVLVEARAFGCPVVASDVGGIPSSVTDDVDGLLVPVGDPGALADAVVRLLDDTGLRHRLVEGGRARAATTTMEAMADVFRTEIGELARA